MFSMHGIKFKSVYIAGTERAPNYIQHSRLDRKQFPPMSLSPHSERRTWRRLRRAQISATNLTTYEPDAEGGHLVEIAYPVIEHERYLLHPEHLAEYSATHQFPTLKCFHNIPARYFTVSSGRYAESPLIGCGHDPDYEAQCGYLIEIREIKVACVNLLTFAYPKGITTSENAMEAYKRRLSNPAVYQSVYRRRRLQHSKKIDVLFAQYMLDAPNSDTQ
uniref:Uncharacterized protein n=1 Tax=Psilocybe cubensis TaxID=181762 RepID=A0A8H8CKX0_PSICU